METVTEIHEIYSFLQINLLRKLKSQIEIEDDKEIQDLLDHAKEFEPDEFSSQYSLVSEKLKLKPHLLERFNLLLDTCYFISSTKKVYSNEISYLNESLNKLGRLKSLKNYSFPGVLSSIDSYIQYRIPSITNYEALDDWLLIMHRLCKEFDYNTVSLKSWLECQYIRVLTNIIHNNQPEATDEPDNLEICKMLLWIHSKITEDKLELVDLKVIAIDHGLYYIARLENKEISKEKDDRFYLNRIIEVLDTITFIGLHDVSDSYVRIRDKYSTYKNFYENLRDSPPKPLQKSDLITSKDDLSFLQSLRCIEIEKSKETNLRQGWKLGYITSIILKPSEFYKKLVAIKFYMGKTEAEVQRYNIEATIMSILSDKKESFIKYYGKYSASLNNMHELGIVYEHCPCTLRDEINKKKRTGIAFTSTELKVLSRILIVSLDYMHSFTFNDSYSGLEALKKGIYHLNIRPDNVLISFEGIYKLINFNTVLGYECISKKTIQQLDLEYMPPEIKERTQDQKIRFIRSKADVYSFGMTILEAATLENPCKMTGTERDKIIDTIKDNEIKDMVKECLSHDIDSRPSFKYLKSMINNQLI